MESPKLENPATSVPGTVVVGSIAGNKKPAPISSPPAAPSSAPPPLLGRRDAPADRKEIVGLAPASSASRNRIKTRARSATSFHFVIKPVAVNTRLNPSLQSSTLFVVGRVSRLSNSDGLQINSSRVVGSSVGRYLPSKTIENLHWWQRHSFAAPQSCE